VLVAALLVSKLVLYHINEIKAKGCFTNNKVR
jgi:hypothetical protein